MSDYPTPTNYQQQEAQQHYAQMREQYAQYQNSGHPMMMVSSNSGTAPPGQSTAQPQNQAQRFSSGTSQLHPNSPHGQLLQQLGHSAASPQQQQQIRHPSPPGPPTMAYQQQNDGARRETPPGGVHPQQGYQQGRQQQVYQPSAPGGQPRFTQPMHGIMGPPQQAMLQAQQQQQMQYRAQQQHTYGGVGQHPQQQQQAQQSAARYAYIQRPEFHHGNSQYIQTMSTAGQGQQGSAYAGGGQRMMLRHPQPVAVQQHPGYHHQPTSHAQYAIPQPGARIYVTASPGGAIYHQQTTIPSMHTDGPSSAGNVYYTHQQHPEEPPLVPTTTGFTPASMAITDQQGQGSGGSGQFVMVGQQPPQSGVLGKSPQPSQTGAPKTAAPKPKGTFKGNRKPPTSTKAAELALSEADQASSAAAKSLLTRAELANLAKGIDMTVTLDEDTADTVLSIVDDFVDALIKGSTDVSKQRGANKLEAKDARFILERRFNLTIPPDSCPTASSTATQAASSTR